MFKKKGPYSAMGMGTDDDPSKIRAILHRKTVEKILLIVHRYLVNENKYDIGEDQQK